MMLAGADPPLMPVRELTNFRLWVVAATAVTHGAFAGFPIVCGPGPELPAATDTKMPASRAPRNATLFDSRYGSTKFCQGSFELPPMEKLITSTPSAVAWSIAATVSGERHVPIAGVVVHALYVIRFACGATPETLRVTSIVGACRTAAFVTSPTAVLAVWL